MSDKTIEEFAKQASRATSRWYGRVAHFNEPPRPPTVEFKAVELLINPDDPPADTETRGRSMVGGKRFHHVRSHLRVKAPRVELVRAHWRGDLSLGAVFKNRRVAFSGEATA